jgi:hypothetical protein
MTNDARKQNRARSRFLITLECIYNVVDDAESDANSIEGKFYLQLNALN